MQPPAPNPCPSCPYRQDVPSGIWHEHEYAKLTEYDGPTGNQSPGVFQCHLTEKRGKKQPLRRICGGWAGCHDGDELLSLRIAAATGLISLETKQRTIDYVSPVPLFASGAEAAAHGMRDIQQPSAEASHAVRKILRVRDDITLGEP